jgi:hypothetical protein
MGKKLTFIFVVVGAGLGNVDLSVWWSEPSVWWSVFLAGELSIFFLFRQFRPFKVRAKGIFAFPFFKKRFWLFFFFS